MGRNDHSKATPYSKAHAAVYEFGHHLASLLVGGGSADFDRISVRQRGEMDWVAVVKAVDSDGLPVVAFGNGSDFVSAVMGVSGAIASDRWRPDQPWTG